MWKQLLSFSKTITHVARTVKNWFKNPNSVSQKVPFFSDCLIWFLQCLGDDGLPNLELIHESWKVNVFLVFIVFIHSFIQQKGDGVSLYLFISPYHCPSVSSFGKGKSYDGRKKVLNYHFYINNKCLKSVVLYAVNHIFSCIHLLRMWAIRITYKK